MRQIALLLAFASIASAAEPAYTVRPLKPRVAEEGGKRFTELPAEQTGVKVANVFEDPRMWGERFRELTLGAVETGIAVADFDKDGKPDIFAVSKNGPCALYMQVAPFKFVNTAYPAGVAVDEPGIQSSNTGVSVVDINADGWPDIYLCRYDLPNLLFINNGGDGTFTENAKAYGLDVKDASVHAVWADYDRDGFVDCYLVTNILDFSKSPVGRRDILFRNTGNGTFKDVTKESGIWGLSQGHTAIWTDFNHDGWPDLYVANDFETPDRLYLNRGDGKFTDVIDERLPHVTYFSMGADSGDINGDGLVDLFITDMRDRNHVEYMTGMEEIGRGLWELERVNKLIPQYMWNAVYLNSGTDRFLEAAHLTGMNATGWTWSARLADLDNDSRLDAFVTAGMIRNFIDADLVDKQNTSPSLTARANVWKNAAPRRETTLAYRNAGNLKFEDRSADWGLDRLGVSFGCVVTDLDNDGDLDLVYANYNEPPSIIRNNSTDGNALIVELVGQGANRFGIGATVEIETEKGAQMRELFTERGIAASDLPILHFGLGDIANVKKITVRWPSGKVQTVDGVKANTRVVIREPAREAAATLVKAVFHTPARADALFTDISAKSGIQYMNTLRPFDEFLRQRLLPRRLNAQGPSLATADVNGDALDDIFVTGTAGQKGRLFLGQKDGSFKPATSQPWDDANLADDTSAAFLDVNGDGALDLFLAAGGVEFAPGEAVLNDRLYLNNGKGEFAPAPEGTVHADGEASGATAVLDIDGDGRSDLFVGSRLIAGKYPAIPRSFLYRNVDGRLTDVTDSVAPALRQIGMVTAATAADLNGDGKTDLVLTTEWGPVHVFLNNGKTLESANDRLGTAGRTGWWSAVEVADMNKDGRLDIIAGNVGLNTKYRASSQEPTLLFAGDFDANGRSALIEAQYDSGKLVPLRGRSKLAYNFPWLPKKFPTYKAFANASVEDIFTRERLEKVQKLSATELSSGIYFQQADGTFQFTALPREAQIAPVNAILTEDFDQDGHRDLLLVGNHFGPEPNTGRFDGGVGTLLCGDGKGSFRSLLPADAGVIVPGDARGAVCLKKPDGKGCVVVISQCDGPTLTFASAK